MTLEKRDGHWFGDTHADLQIELSRYAEKAGYAIDHFLDVVCSCGNGHFSLDFDEE